MAHNKRMGIRAGRLLRQGGPSATGAGHLLSQWAG